MMITPEESKRLSKFLSYVLRHHPEQLGIQLDENGWTDTTLLIEQLNGHGYAVSKEILQHIVATNSKKRFAFNKDEQQIRASQGHSVAIALGYEPQVPPVILYHGTAQKFVAAIMAQGICRQSRQYVHLSADKETAHQVGTRHGKPHIFEVDAALMAQQGHIFYLSDNGVWLTEHVPPVFLK